jgi:NAD(P)H dehydrogenase (quinone)
MTCAVTGVTGPFGRTVVETLLARGVAPSDVVAIARTPAKAAELAERGVQVREGDYDRPDTLGPALAGVDRLLLVSGSEIGRRIPQHTAVVTAAAAAGVARILYTSVTRADGSHLLTPEHSATEHAIADSGLAYSILRNALYLEVFVGRRETALATGTVAHAAGDGRVASALRADLAEAAANALLHDDGPSTVRELAGPVFTYADLAAAFAEVSGRPVEAKALTADELITLLTGAGVDGGAAGFAVALDQAIGAGEFEVASRDLAELLGREPVSLLDAVRAAG